jgi:hypothetical protein
MHDCRDCQALPRDERRAIEARLEIEGFLFHQSHISAKNVDRLRQHTQSPGPAVASTAAVVLQVAVIAPYKRKRLRTLRHVRPDLIKALVEMGLIWSTPVEDPADLEYSLSKPLERESLRLQTLEESLAEDIPF